MQRNLKTIRDVLIQTLSDDGENNFYVEQNKI